jgi:DNA sulfur modification protein DndE
VFTSIKTSKDNKEVVTKLTRKLGLGAENVIARLAFSYSLASDRKMDLEDMQDAQGKEYSAKVLFGEYVDFYIALVCVHYNIRKSDKDIARYVKMHIDDGLERIYNEIEKKTNITGEEFLINAIEKGLKYLA